MDLLSARLEAAQKHVSTVEDELTDVLIAIGLTLNDWSDWHYDPYDGELLITGCAGLTDEQARRLRELGFAPRTTPKRDQ